MNNHIIKILAIAAVAVAYVSCKKDKSEWSDFRGYTRDDVAGTYVFSESGEAFKNLTEGDYCILCPEAEINIVKSGQESVKFKINCPDHNYNKEFVGKTPLNPNDFLIDIRGNKQWQGPSSFIQNRVQSRVYRNDKNEIRLAGSGIQDAYEIKEHFIYGEQHQIVDTIYDTIFKSSRNYYFDVIKE